MRDFVIRLAQPASLLLLPVLAHQGRRVKREVPRLPDADGKEGRVQGRAPEEMRLLVTGDSVAAGVGVDHNDDALAGHLAAFLASCTGRSVSWRVIARGGATARYVTRNFTSRMLDPLTQWRPDAVVISVGLNDLLRFRRLTGWKHDIERLTADIHHRLGPATPVVFSGLPPVGHFPALPRPLRTVLASRARVMDRTLERVAERMGATHLTMPVHLMQDETASFFALDRFHPSARGYRELGRHFAQAITTTLPPRNTP